MWAGCKADSGVAACPSTNASCLGPESKCGQTRESILGNVYILLRVPRVYVQGEEEQHLGWGILLLQLAAFVPSPSSAAFMFMQVHLGWGTTLLLQRAAFVFMCRVRKSSIWGGPPFCFNWQPFSWDLNTSSHWPTPLLVQGQGFDHQ